MSLDLLKEKFGVSKSTDNKKVDKKKLNEMFNSNPMGKLESFKTQHQGELQEKDRIIESLKAETSNLANQVLNLEKDKSDLLNELNQSKWLENTVASNTKKLYEDKIKKMNIVDSTKLIPLLIEVSREKQGNTKLNWGKWLETPENIYLFKINESIARKVFEDTNLLIDEKINYINKKRRTYVGDAENYNIRFGGQSGNRAFVRTDFNPDNLRFGYTVSYWVRPDELEASNRMFAFGRKHTNNQRFGYGFESPTQMYIGIGPKQSRPTWASMGAPSNSNLSYLFNADNSLKTGNWIHFAATYGNRTETGADATHTLYINGIQVHTTNENWSAKGGGTSGMFLGARNLTNAYNRGLACGLDEVAIYDTDKGTSFAQEVYSGGINYNHKGADNLVGYWKMNEGSGNKVIDHSGNGNHGTLDTDGSEKPTWEEIKRYK